MPTIREFAKRFMAEYKPRQKSGERKSKERIIDNQLLPYFGDLRLDENDQSHVNAYVATLKVSVKTINNRLAVLSTLLKYAGPRGCKLIPEPTLSFHVDGMDAEVIAVPAADAAKLVATATDDRYKVAVLLAAEAGLRIGEIRGMQWTDIKDGRVTIRRPADTQNNVGAPKHNKMRTVKLSPALQDAMGHSDIKTTMRYVTVTENQRDEAIDLAFGSERQPVGNRHRLRA